MAVDKGRVLKPTRQLRGLCKRSMHDWAPEAVHHLRTVVSRFETTAAALRRDSHPKDRRALSALARARKRAGKVRDLYVLLQHATALHPAGEGECLLRLIEVAADTVAGHRRGCTLLRRMRAGDRRRALAAAQRMRATLARSQIVGAHRPHSTGVIPAIQALTS